MNPPKPLFASISKLVLLVMTLGNLSTAQTPRLLIRCDDIGMTHAVNQAFLKVLDTKLPVSASVMFVCPWYQEAVAILRNHPDVAVGVHLTLNAEWQNYRWGPIYGASLVPSLVDSVGFFFPSRQALADHQPKTDEIERELRAQIQRALQTGLRIDYIDYHMGTAVSTPEWRAIIEKLAHEFGLGISRYFGEIDAPSHYSLPPNQKTVKLCTFLSQLPTDTVSLMVFHIGIEGSEMDAMLDLNPHGLTQMSKHRQAELNALTSRKFATALRKNNIQLMTYRDLIRQIGLQNMHAPH